MPSFASAQTFPTEGTPFFSTYIYWIVYTPVIWPGDPRNEGKRAVLVRSHE